MWIIFKALPILWGFWLKELFFNPSTINQVSLMNYTVIIIERHCASSEEWGFDVIGNETAALGIQQTVCVSQLIGGIITILIGIGRHIYWSRITRLSLVIIWGIIHWFDVCHGSAPAQNFQDRCIVRPRLILNCFSSYESRSDIRTIKVYQVNWGNTFHYHRPSDFQGKR